MARFGLWVALLSLCVLAATVNSQTEPTPPGANMVCNRFAGDELNIHEVYDIINSQYKSKIQNINTELLQELMDFADDDQNGSLNLDECENLFQWINKKRN